MECRSQCGVCCITISITSPIPGMPYGKPAGIPCIHLTDNYQCSIFESKQRPEVCKGFKPERVFCGNSRQEAIKILTQLEFGKIEAFK